MSSPQSPALCRDFAEPQRSNVDRVHRPNLDGEEGVIGSSPIEGFAQVQEIAGAWAGRGGAAAGLRGGGGDRCPTHAARAGAGSHGLHENAAAKSVANCSKVRADRPSSEGTSSVT
jgi:hypothetical protein